MKDFVSILPITPTSFSQLASTLNIARLLALIPLLWLFPVFAANFEQLLDAIEKKIGDRPQIFFEWKRLIDDGKSLQPPEKLKRVNEFINRRIQFADDILVWGQSDYWATPMETLSKGKGDCEDFTIAKYFTLLNLGIPDEQLRLVYVKARLGGPASKIQQAHMVLAYYSTPDAEPMILDNLITDIRPASRRSDLQPVFSFNSKGIWQGSGGNDAKAPGGPERLSRWADLLRRARAEGFD